MKNKCDNLEKIEKFSSYKDKVYHTLKEAILNDVFKPGETMMERSIANQLGVSRTPVREALKLLEHEGWVETIPWKGVFVKSLSMKEVKDLIQLRIATEGFVIGEIAENITDQEIELLNDNLRKQKQFSDQGLRAEEIRIDREFHLNLCKLLGNEKMIQLHESLREQIHRYGLRALATMDRPKHSYDEHVQIVEALKQRDREGAIRALEYHLRNTLQAISHSLQREDHV